MEDLLYFILIVVVFLGPLLKKIFEAAGGGSSSRPSREEVREYLEKMRKARNRSESQLVYQTPPKKQRSKAKKKEPQPVEENKFDQFSKDLETTYSARGQFDRIENAVEADINEHVLEHIYHGKEQKREQKPVATPGERFRKLIIDREDFSEFQKAIVLSEIFGKPKSLSQKSLM